MPHVDYPYWAFITAMKFAGLTFVHFCVYGVMLSNVPSNMAICLTFGCYIDNIFLVLDVSLRWSFFAFLFAYTTSKIYQLGTNKKSLWRAGDRKST